MTYTEIIAQGLKVDFATAEKIQNFINCWFNFHWSNSTKAQILKNAREAYAMMQDPKCSKMVEMMEAN